jgi:hypothetical protein
MLGTCRHARYESVYCCTLLGHNAPLMFGRVNAAAAWSCRSRHKPAKACGHHSINHVGVIDVSYLAQRRRLRSEASMPEAADHMTTAPLQAAWELLTDCRVLIYTP